VPDEPDDPDEVVVVVDEVVATDAAWSWARWTPMPPTRRVEAVSRPDVHRRARLRARGTGLMGTPSRG
jgi:hypothetical protein